LLLQEVMRLRPLVPNYYAGYWFAKKLL
jgi:hypothetical protein